MAASSSSQQSKVLILDGGLGTSLEDKYGIKFESATTPLWSTHLLVDGQDTLLACQKDFGDVPVDIILTATYQLSIHGFANTRTAQFPNGIDKANIGNFIQDAIRIADEAGRSQGSKTALSIGPYGACMIPGQEYSGAYDADHDTLEKLRDWHAERLQLFQSAAAFSSPVSYVAIETIPRTDEIKASYESAVKELIQEGAVDAAPALILYPDGTNGEVYNTTTQKLLWVDAARQATLILLGSELQ
ncbi:homocysteine S-methyltransferase [Colletotrichum lupini]|uniref:Homocysteine S-methyltransferase n=1 Tax=Colletotrichum lupini TaxID=145971 RepID=A0A9Q8T0K8_9PEZI|nr:homocysteine S-methyltransferase [Colletotrichum lupini]UQC86027.1 homocysteine S-methyltransferase [Colletotrichum lupini]